MRLHEADHSVANGSDVLRSYVYCRYKAYLKLSSQIGVRSTYELALTELRAESKKGAVGKLEALASTIPSSIELTFQALRLGHRAIIDGSLNVDGLSIRIDGLRRVDGRSELGDFHYEPLLFYEGPTVREPERLFLSTVGTLLSRLQGKEPDRGVIYQGCGGTSSAVKLQGRSRAAKSILDDIARMQRGELQPKLLLNNHCRVCEFQQRCHLEAVREGNLSLLRGVRDKEIRRLNRKGVLTLT